MLTLVNGPRVEERGFEPLPGEAVVRLGLGGICATDLELIKGYMGFDGVLGHEWVGVVESAPDPAWVGRRVVGEINCSCHVCPTCLAGRPSHCPTRTVLGILGRDGAFSERFCLPQRNLHVVPDGVSDEAAVFAEPLAAACRILEQVHVGPSDRVVVLGAGRLGQLCARVLALTGAEVTAVNRSPGKLERLSPGIRGVGIDDAPRGVDVVVACTGASGGLALATDLVRPGGTIVLKTTVKDPAGLDPTRWVIDEIRVVASRCGPFEPALRLMESGAVRPEELVDARRPLASGVEALAEAAAPGTLKVLLDPAG